MNLICNSSIFYGEHRIWGLYYKQKQIKHNSNPVQYMEWIWIWSVMIYILWKTWILRSLLQAKADKTSFNSSTVYGMDMDLICNWSIFYEKHKFWGPYFKQNQIKHHSTPVQYMEWIWISYVIDLYSIENKDFEVFIASKIR